MKSSHFAIAGSTPMTFQLVARSVSSSAWANSLCCPECEVTLSISTEARRRPAVTTPGYMRLLFAVVFPGGERTLDSEDMLLFELAHRGRNPRAALVRAAAARTGTALTELSVCDDRLSNFDSAVQNLPSQAGTSGSRGHSDRRRASGRALYGATKTVLL